MIIITIFNTNEPPLIKGGYIKNQWQKEVSFLKTQKKTILITTAIFLISIVIAAILCFINPEIVDYGMKYILTAFKDITGNETNNELFTFIVSNNFRAMTAVILLGILPFLFLPIFSLISNGAIISIVFFTSSSQMGTIAMIAHILPHGIIELPMIWLACSLGFYLCLTITKKIIKGASLTKALENVLRTYLMIIVPGTLIAALIESYITPYFGSLFL